MSQLFGGNSKSHDIRELATRLMETSGAICNENVAGAKISNFDVTDMADSIRKLMNEHYADMFPQQFDELLAEDAKNAAQIFMNGIAEMSTARGTVNESAVMPNLVTLTASVATTMRTPYEAVMHRMFDTRTIDKQIVEIETVIPTVKAPTSNVVDDLVDAFAPSNPNKFVDRTELAVQKLTEGLVPSVKDVDLLPGANPLFRINRDVRVTKIDATIGGAAVDPKNISLVKGAVPYFDAKTSILNCIFEIKAADGSITHADVTAKINFDRNIMEYIRCDGAVTKVYFYATVAHSEHTHPIHTAFRNYFQEYIVPTRPHIEVSLPTETRTDISNSINHFSNTDIVTAMTENITVISSRMEDQRLEKCLQTGYKFEGQFSFEAPANFNYGNLEWTKREFIPFLDQCAQMMRNDYNITDCHFRVAVSPYILRILDTDFSMDKNANESNKGSGVINYSIGCKTSTATFYFISSQLISDADMQMLLIPNNFKNSQVKTYNYFKYSSFLTDQLRRADNHALPAVVYSERNLPIVFENLASKINMKGLAVTKTDGVYWVKKV